MSGSCHARKRSQPPDAIIVWCTAGEQAQLLSSLTCLTQLNMKGCYRVGDQGLSQLAALHHLHSLNLHGCWQITAAGLAHITGLYFHPVKICAKHSIDTALPQSGICSLSCLIPDCDVLDS